MGVGCKRIRPAPLSKLLLQVKKEHRGAQGFRTKLSDRITATEVYKQLPKATVALQVTSTPLLDHHWVTDSVTQEEDSSETTETDSTSSTGSTEEDDPEAKFDILTGTKEQGYFSLGPLPITRGDMFALLAAFESGTLNLDPTTLTKVVAMSSGDSIYVASQLLVDPADSSRLGTTSICRILGNVGRPGIAMLIPPAEPMIRQRDSADWKVINHSPFDGKYIDGFQGTSLHLSFSEYNQPIYTGIHGAKDTEIYFLEALVSVHDGKEWIGDLDIIGSLQSLKCYLHQTSSECTHPAQNLRAFPTTSIDNWDEFLDNPNAIFIVRAKDNWVARLASMSLSVQRQHQTVVVSHEQPICWPCIRNIFSLRSSTKTFAVIA
jgi:hypothetical protein